MKRTLGIALLIGFAAFNIQASENNPQQKSKDSATKVTDPSKDQGERKLSRRERKDRRKLLADKYQQWLIDVEPIMMPNELDAFLILESDPQRDLYIEAFWRRRDPDLKTARNEYRDRYAEALEVVRTKYRNTSADPARTLLLRGEPNEVTKIDCTNLVQPIEIWQYGYLPGLGRNVLLIFYQPRTGIDVRLFTPMGNLLEALENLLSIDGQRYGVQNVFFGYEQTSMGTMRSMPRIFAECRDGELLLDAINWADRNKNDIERSVFEQPKVDEEDVNKFLRTAVISNPDAPKLKTDMTAAFPGKRGGRTAVEMTLTFDRSTLVPKEIEGAKFYNVDVTGEILKDGKLFENYHYRYDFPGATAGEQLAVVVERFLRPADYVARIKVLDINSGAEAIIEKPLVVPQFQESAAQIAQAEEASTAIKRLQDDFREGESRIRIVPFGNDMVIGLQKIETMVTGNDIKAVEFYLNKKKVMVKRSPPYTLELDFGTIPQQHRVRAVGLNDKKQIVAGDELVLNTGTDPFRVHIVTPRVAPDISGKVRVEVDASIPEGKSLEKLEIFHNETKLATLFSPPFVQTIDIPATAGIGYIRAVATLKDDSTQPAEDVVFINSPEFVQEVDVHLVELPVTVLRDGKVATGLKQEDFRVLDEGQPATISKFEFVQNLPLSIGIAIDASASMRPRMGEAQKAGAEFLKNVLRSGDKAFVVAFDDQPLMIQKWSPRLSDLNAGLASIRAEDSTALYDAVVLSLYNFLGVRGQKALVVISDGEDTASKFTHEQAVEYAKRAAVPIYIIGIGVGGARGDLKMKLQRFANETGGNVYYISSAGELKRTYDDIEKELRSQYVLGIYPPSDVKVGSKWREVDVTVRDGKVKTIRGYYP